MVHQKSDFLHNYKQFLEHDDVEGLRDLFTSHIAGVIVHHKPELIANLKRIGVTNIEPTISNQQLANNVTEAIYAKNKKIIDLIVSMILTDEGQSEYMNVDADSPDAKAKTKGGAKLSGDQITDLVGTVATGLSSIMGVAKSAIDAKREKQQTKNSINDNINTQQQQIIPQQQTKSGMSTGAVVGIVVVVVIVAGVIGFVLYNRSKTPAGAPAAQPAAANA